MTVGELIQELQELGPEVTNTPIGVLDDTAEFQLLRFAPEQYYVDEHGQIEATPVEYVGMARSYKDTSIVVVWHG